MSDKAYPTIEPIKITEYELKQSKYGDIVPKLPCRSILLGPSGSGKTILLQNLILNIYKNCFERIYIFSPSVDVDTTWLPVKKYIEEDMKIDVKKEPCYFDHYNAEDLMNIISQQHKITDFMKKKKEKKLYSILIIVDDFADDPSFSRHSKLLHSLFTRGRHSSISTIVATQKFSCLATIIRCNATELYVYRLRNYTDLEKFMDEVSAVADKKTILELYNIAVGDQPYSFLYVNLRAKDVNSMFMVRFEKKLLIE